MNSERYNDVLVGMQQLGVSIELRTNDLDILELFAQNKALTASDITHLIKSTELEKAPKNVNRQVHKRSLGLIEETKLEKIRLHNEKYYKLTDRGIYHLINYRVEGIIYDQLSGRKGISVSHISQFLKNYENNLVFRLFLYPYFEKETL